MRFLFRCGLLTIFSFYRTNIQLKVKAAYEKKRKSNSGSEDGTSSNTNETINDDAVAEVYRMRKQGGTRGVGSHVSKKQYQVATIGQIIHEQSKPANVDDIIELKNSIASLEKLVKVSLLFLTCFRCTFKKNMFVK